MIRHLVTAAGLVATLVIAAPASAGLIGSTASTTFTSDDVGLGLGVSPSSATVAASTPEFTYSITQFGSVIDVFSGNVEASAFIFSYLRGNDFANFDRSFRITLALDPGAMPITGFTATITGFTEFAASDVALSGNTLTFAPGRFGAVPGASVVVDFTFADLGSNRVPEPASLGLLAAEMLGLAALARRRRA